MTAKKKYRKILLALLCLDIFCILYLGYRYLDRKIPDELYVVKGTENQIEEILENPWIRCEEAITVSQEGSFRIPCRLLGVIPWKQVKVQVQEETSLYASGSPVGIYMETQGVLVVDTGEIIAQDGTVQEPAKNIIQPGDYIVSYNRQQIENKKVLMEEISQCEGTTAQLEVLRNGETVPVAVHPVQGEDGTYKLGIWIRDNTQGIGTLTFVDKQGRYGALGHGISDVDTGELLNMDGGILYKAQILGIEKGKKGIPGELTGLISYQEENRAGDIQKNCGNGIYGNFIGNETEEFQLQEYPVGYKQDMEIGPASILCSVNGKVDEYGVEITKIDMNHEDTNKSFVISVTDENLLELTGGIVQGMSGSPVIQNGHIVGAVTHVFVQDSAGGYGIFIENMLKEREDF
ncbi:MAG TPA: SpoIVB peptidase [Candidatus Blautia avistercoris]|nr:SpoIVB peptidase [Candidatus Blautia avistercoris]